MKKDETTFSCRVCEKPVLVETGLCDACGFQHAKNIKTKLTLSAIIVLIIFAVVVLGSMQSTEVTVFDEDALLMPDVEKKFIETLVSYRDEYMQGQQKSAELMHTAIIVLRAQRKQDIAKLGMSFKATDWVGRVAYHKKTKHNNIIFRVNIFPSVALETWSDEAHDAKENTIIKPTDPLYSVVENLAEDDLIFFSGSFFNSNEDYFEETSLTMEATLQLPTFLFKFSSIRKQQVAE